MSGLISNNQPPPVLIPCINKNFQTVWQNSIYCAATPLQEGCARAFRHEMARPFDGHPKDNPDTYFRSLPEVELRPKRERLAKLLKEFGFDPIVPDGGYFMIADCSSLMDKIPVEELDDTDDPRDYKGLKIFSPKTDFN